MCRRGRLAAMFTPRFSPRPGRPEDAREFVRLRRLMFQAMGSVAAGNGWEDAADLHYRVGLADRSLIAVVVDQPDKDGLAATGVARLVSSIASPGAPDGRGAYISSLCTDVGFRRHGLARMILAELIARIEGEGISRIDLHATPEGLPLYESFGFALRSYPNLQRLSN